MNELLLFPLILAAVPALVVVYLAGHSIKNVRLVIVKRGCSFDSVAKKRRLSRKWRINLIASQWLRSVVNSGHQIAHAASTSS